MLGSNALIGISGYSKHRELGVFESLANATINTLSIIQLTSNSLKGLVVGDIPISQLSGIVGIGQIAGDTAKSNSRPILALIGLMAFISANLGFINILPIENLFQFDIFFLIMSKYLGIIIFSCFYSRECESNKRIF